MYRNKFLFNYLITYEYGGEPISNLINGSNQVFKDYNWIIFGFINIFDGIITPTEKKNETENYKKQFYPVM